MSFNLPEYWNKRSRIGLLQNARPNLFTKMQPLKARANVYVHARGFPALLAVASSSSSLDLLLIG